MYLNKKEMNVEYSKKKNAKSRTPKIFKLGEEIANGIKYWGKESLNKNKSRVATCICHCNNSWREVLSKIINGQVESCGCLKIKKEK